MQGSHGKDCNYTMNGHMRATLLICLFCLGLLLVGCENAAGCPRVLPPLNVPGAHKISAFSALRSSGHDIIWSLNAYRDANASDAAPSSRVLVSLNGQLVSLTLDGTIIHKVPTEVPCGLSAVTPDGQWAACTAERTICDDSYSATCFTSSIEVVPLAAGASTHSHYLVAATPGIVYRSPAWAPNGQELAVISSSQGDTCSLVIFVSVQPYTEGQVIARLLFPMFLHPGLPDPCALATVSWSPDGKWFALTTGKQLYLLSAGVLPPTASQRLQSPVSLTVTPDQLTLIGETLLMSPAAWTPDAHAIAFTSADGYGIQTYVLASRIVDTILRQTQPQSQLQLRAVAWASDGRQLLVGIIAPGIVECGTAPSDLYLYSPPGNRPSG